jgi:two-component system, sensor histidine kinase PdtaS
MSLTERFTRLPTAAKLLLILTAAILPIGIALVWVGETGIQQANDALKGQAQADSRAAADGVQSLIARNVLALRIAANGALAQGPAGACDRALRALSVAPAVTQKFEIETADGESICSKGAVGESGALPLVAPGNVSLSVAPGAHAVAIRVGVIGGMATALVPVEEIRAVAIAAPGEVESMVLHDDSREIRILGPPPVADLRLRLSESQIGNERLFARIGAPDVRVNVHDRLILLLPVLMWVAAALISWLLVSRLLVRPLKRLERAVVHYQPGDTALDLPRKLGPSTEIQELRDAFTRAVTRVDDSEREMTSALEGQRRLVREVHHRVKNNLQVVASLLNIHGRSADTDAARAAYAGIGRRVGALSIVHRSHFAEMEENRGIAVRPLVSELAAELRAGAPEAARTLRIDLELDTVSTTQDVAVAVAFLVTEIVEFAMLNRPMEPIEISLRRASELTARLTFGSPVLNPEDSETQEKVQFERIIAGLAKQLRSPLDRKFGRYSVDLPVFPQP